MPNVPTYLKSSYKSLSKADRELLKSPEFTGQLLAQLGTSGVVVLNRVGSIIYCNERALRLLKTTGPKLHGKSFSIALKLKNERGVELREKQRPDWLSLHKRGYHQIMPFFSYLHRPGHAAVQVVIKAIQIKQAGKIAGAVIQIRDAQRKLNVDEMKTLFVSFAAHQLKTPSSIVKGFLELMLRGRKSAYPTSQWDNLLSAYESNENLIALSKSLLNLTRLEGGLIEPKLQKFDTKEILQSKIDSHRTLIGVKSLEIKFNSRGSKFIFETDQTFFSEIFEVLLSNALKHAPKSSVLRIELAVRPSEITVHVIDEGPGMNAEQQSRLFISTGELNAEQNSHGIGLLMAKKYLDLLDGTVGVRSKEGKGSDFFFTIPKPIQ